MTDGADRRGEQREPITLLVDYAGHGELVTDFTENLSMGGTFVQTQRDLAVGAEVRLLLSCPGLIEPIALPGVVRWTRSGSEDSEPGCGIQFSDYDDAARERLHSIIEAIGARDPEYIGRVINLLLVEDNALIINLLRDGLTLGRNQLDESIAFRFTVATDGQQALEQLANETFDIAVVDMYLPMIDGATVIQRLRSAPRTQYLPIIAISAGGRDAADLALNAGADRFLSKPIRLKEVLDALGGLLTT